MYAHLSTLRCMCTDFTHQCAYTQTHTHTLYNYTAHIQLHTSIPPYQYTCRLTHTIINTFIYILIYTQTYRHALTGVTILSPPEASRRGGGGEEGGRRGGGLCYAKWWLAVAMPTREGQSQRLVEEELQADYKTVWAAVSPLQSCLHCISVSLFSLYCYLAS